MANNKAGELAWNLIELIEKSDYSHSEKKNLVNHIISYVDGFDARIFYWEMRDLLYKIGYTELVDTNSDDKYKELKGTNSRWLEHFEYWDTDTQKVHIIITSYKRIKKENKIDDYDFLMLLFKEIQKQNETSDYVYEMIVNYVLPNFPRKPQKIKKEDFKIIQFLFKQLKESYQDDLILGYEYDHYAGNGKEIIGLLIKE